MENCHIHESVEGYPDFYRLLKKVLKKISSRNLPPRTTIFVQKRRNITGVEEERIYFSPKDFVKLGKKTVIGLIAHELAHVSLGHSMEGDVDFDLEEEADRFAARGFGFEKEIEKFREEFPLKKDSQIHQ